MRAVSSCLSHASFACSAHFGQIPLLKMNVAVRAYIKTYEGALEGDSIPDSRTLGPTLSGNLSR